MTERAKNRLTYLRIGLLLVGALSLLQHLDHSYWAGRAASLEAELEKLENSYKGGVASLKREGFKMQERHLENHPPLNPSEYICLQCKKDIDAMASWQTTLDYERRQIEEKRKELMLIKQ